MSQDGSLGDSPGVSEAELMYAQSVPPGSQHYKTSGIAVALLVGVNAALLNLPWHVADKKYCVTRESWMLSFGIGAIGGVAVYTLCLWLLSVWVPHVGFPRLRPALVAGPGLAAGLMWTCGYWMQVWAIQYLGIAIAQPMTQCQLIVSCMWGVLYYREIRGRTRLLLTAGAASCMMAGIVLLH